MVDHLLTFSNNQPSTRGTSKRDHAAEPSSSKPTASPAPASENPMISEQELERLLESDFKTPEDAQNLVAQRRRDFDREWGIPADAEDDFSPLTR